MHQTLIILIYGETVRIVYVVRNFYCNFHYRIFGELMESSCEMSSEPYRALCISSLNPDASDDDVKESLLEILRDFKFVNAKVLCEPDKERTAFAVFRYVEDAETAFIMHKDMLLCGKPVDVIPVLIDDPIMETLLVGNKSKSRREHERENERENERETEPRYTPRGRGASRGFRRGRGRGRSSDFREQHRATFPMKHKFRPPSRHLFIGSIAPCTSEKDLRRIFEPYGYILSIDRKPNYAFVKFFTIDMALHAKKSLQGELIDGATCKIGFGTSSPSPCLYIGRIGEWTSEKEILSEFSQFGKVVKFEWPHGKTYAYILFDRLREAQAAYEGLQGLPLGRQNKRILLDYADEVDIETSLNYEEPHRSAADVDYNDEGDWNEFEDYSYQDDVDAVYSISRSPDRHDYDRYAPESDRRVERVDRYDRSPIDRREWRNDRDVGYSPRGKSWHSKTAGTRGRSSDRRGNWRGYGRKERDNTGSSLRGHRQSRDRDTRRYEKDYESNDRGYRRDNRREYERDDRRSRVRDDRHSFERDRRSFDRDDKRRENRSPDRDSFRRSPDRDSFRTRGKRERSADSRRSFERDYRARRSRSGSFDRSHRKRSHRSSHISPERMLQHTEHDNRRSSDRNFAVMPSQALQPNHLPLLNPTYPPPALPPSTAVYPQNPLGVFPQPSIVPAYQPTLQDPYSSAAAAPVSYYPPVGQPLPDFSVPPPPLRTFPSIVQEPLPVTPSNVHSQPGRPSSEIASRFPVVWSGALVLKNSAFVTNMYLLSGSVLLVDALLRDQSADCPVLKITQRLRLDEPDKVKEVERRVNMSGRNGCSVLLAVPATAEVGDVNNIIQQRPLTALGSYLREKAVAAVILLPPGSSAGAQTGILHAFPKCDFAREFLKKEAPELAADYPKDDHLLVIVMRETGE